MRPLHNSSKYLFRKTGVFSAMNTSFLKRLNAQKKTYEFKRGEIIYHEDSTVTGLYFLHSGLVKHYKISPDGQQYIFRLSGKGEFLEMEALLAEKDYLTAAKTLRAGVLHFIPKLVIQDILKKDSIFCQEIMKMMANRVRRSNIERVELAMGNVRERLAHLLTFLAKEYGEPEDQGIKINLNVNISEMAEMIGTVPETASRHLKEFRAESLIVNRRNNIRILDLPSLQNVARLD